MADETLSAHLPSVTPAKPGRGGARPGAGRKPGSRTRYLYPKPLKKPKPAPEPKGEGTLIAAVCKKCGEAFSYPRPRHGAGKKYCSLECSNFMKARTGEVRACKTCGDDYHARYNGSGYCSIACRRYPDAKFWDSKADRSSFHRAKRRVWKRREGYERFARKDIYERDGWLCGICGEPVDPKLKYPDLMSASLDHVVPLALGGQHRRSNVQCAHFLCNSRKTHRGVSEKFKT